MEKKIRFYVPMLPRFVSDFHNVVELLARSGYETTVLIPAKSGGTTAWSDQVVVNRYQKALPMETTLAPLPFVREHLNPISMLRTMLHVYRMEKADPSIGVFWTIIPILLCGLPMRFRNQRCVFLQTGMGSVFGDNSLKMRIVRSVVKVLYRYLYSGENSRVILHNAEDRDYLHEELGIKKNHMAVTGGCGADPDEFPFFENLPDNPKKVVLYPARLLVEKGVLDTAKASQILRDRGVEHEMRFSSTIDEGNPSSITREDVARLERENDWIRFIGYHPSVAPLYEACDIVCLPTWYREGLPTTLIEASACGRPIVACDSVGSRDIIIEGETGLIVPPRSPEKLADALQRLIEDNELAERLRRNAYAQFLKKFTKNAMLEITADILLDLGLELKIDSIIPDRQFESKPDLVCE